MLLDLLHHHHHRPPLNPGARPVRMHVPMPPKRKRRPRKKRQEELAFLRP